MHDPSPFFCLANLSSAKAERLDPLKFKHSGYPSKDKKAFRAWCADASTDHLFYNLSEGLNASLRVSAENPPQFLHGLVVDFDTTVGDEEFSAMLARRKLRFLPSYGSRTFSGGARLVWLFQRPLPIHSPAILNRVLAKAKKVLALSSILPGLDENAFIDPHRYYEVGTQWQDLGGAPVPPEVVWQWIESSSRRKDFQHGAVIPMGVIAQEVERRFPGRWNGPFEEGARGVRFWDASADAQAVIIRDCGCQCFTGDKPFVSWANIFGQAFVQQFQERKIGGAIEGIYFDGRHYWRQLPDRSWQAMNATTVGRHLRVEFGFDPDPYGQPASELDRVIHEIEQHKAVVGALPFVHNKNTLVRINKKVYLNISTAKCLEPAPGSQAWGENFPFIADYYERLFDEEPRRIYLSWLSRFYKSAYEGHLLKGQALFIAGPVGVGKTLGSERIVALLLGGKQEATDFLLGGSSFNKELFEYAVWTIDDDPVSGDPKAHLRFSNLVKKVAANHTFNYHAKFRDQLTVPWNGRIVVTCNDDPESIRILPDLDVSIKDKLILLKTSKNAIRDFPADVVEPINQSLPFFARWLLDYEIPSDCRGDNRFGVRSYIDPELEETARQSSVTNAFAEILDLWRDNYFSLKAKLPHWKGTATELLREMQLDQTLEKLLRDVNARVVGRHLATMVVQGYSCVRFKRQPGSGKREYTILNGKEDRSDEPVGDPF